MIEILPFQDLPITKIVEDKSEEELLAEIEEWAEGRTAFYSIAFMVLEGDPQIFSSYSLRLGRISDSHLTTNVKRIIEISEMVTKFPEDIQPLLKEAIEPYFEKIQRIPYWGTKSYNILVAKGKTPRVLYGPHTGGELKSGQSRLVVFNDKRELVYGPKQL